MSCEEDVFKMLREKGFRLTPQREMVLSAMHDLQGMGTAEEILGRVQTTTSSVDISTIYRTLELLQDVHVVASVTGNDGQRRYELVGNHAPHVHLVCRSCGEVLGADLEGFQSFVAHVKGRYGFRVGVEQLSITGLCRECCAAGE